MDVIILWGPPAAGKLTVARELAERTGFALFHNHLVVDAVGAVFTFADAEFARLRERWWLDMIGTAAEAGRSLIFTLQPEPTVAADFPERLAALITAKGGRARFVRLACAHAEQDQRIDSGSRAAFGKLRSLDLLRQLRPDFDAAEAAMPSPDLMIDTAGTSPDEAADLIVKALDLTR